MMNNDKNRTIFEFWLKDNDILGANESFSIVCKLLTVTDRHHVVKSQCANANYNKLHSSVLFSDLGFEICGLVASSSRSSKKFASL